MEQGSASTRLYLCTFHDWGKLLDERIEVDREPLDEKLDTEYGFLWPLPGLQFMLDFSRDLELAKERRQRHEKLRVREQIFEAIKRSECEDIKEVVLSEKYFIYKWPLQGVLDAIVVPAVVFLAFVYLYLIGYIDKGGFKVGSSSSLEFRDIYISILLFRAAYVWIKFRDVIPRGGVYQKPGSDKFEPRIKFPVTRGRGDTSKRIPLRSYNSEADAEVVYRIAAFYCNKEEHTDQLDLGGGAYFSIPAFSVDHNLSYEENVEQVRDQVLKVYAEFKERRASWNQLRSVTRPAFEMPTQQDHFLPTSPSQQLQEPLNSGNDPAMQGQGSQLAPNTHNGDDFNNPNFLLRLHAETQHELLDAYKQIECLKAQVTRTEVENMAWEVKYSELSKKFSELEQRNSELVHEIGLLNRENMQLQSQFQIQHEEQELDIDRFLA